VLTYLLTYLLTYIIEIIKYSSSHPSFYKWNVRLVRTAFDSVSW